MRTVMAADWRRFSPQHQTFVFQQYSFVSLTSTPSWWLASSFWQQNTSLFLTPTSTVLRPAKMHAVENLFLSLIFAVLHVSANTLDSFAGQSTATNQTRVTTTTHTTTTTVIQSDIVVTTTHKTITTTCESPNGWCGPGPSPPAKDDC